MTYHTYLDGLNIYINHDWQASYHQILNNISSLCDTLVHLLHLSIAGRATAKEIDIARLYIAKDR